MDKQVAAQLFLNKSKDQNIWLLSAWKLLQKADAAEVEKHYQRIVAGELTVVSVKSSIELTAEQKTRLEKGVEQKYSGNELIFVYALDPNTDKGIEVIVGDDRIEFN